MPAADQPVQDGEIVIERPPSLRFRILFALVMLVIAVGYTWVWHTKTSRAVAEAPPDFILGEFTSRVAGHGPADGEALREQLAADLRTVPRLVLVASLAEVQLPTDGRLPPPVYALSGVLDRTGDGGYSLEVRRTDARTDSTVYIYRVRGSTLAEVTHRMAVQVAMSYGLPRPVRDTALPLREPPRSAAG